MPDTVLWAPQNKPMRQAASTILEMDAERGGDACSKSHSCNVEGPRWAQTAEVRATPGARRGSWAGTWEGWPTSKVDQRIM